MPNDYTPNDVLHRGKAAAWVAANPVLPIGESGLETDTGKMKHGDGVTPYSGLQYLVPTPLVNVAGAYRIDPTGGSAVSNGTDIGTNGRWTARHPKDLYRLKVALPNWANGSGTHVGEIPGANNITVRAAIEYPSGTYTPLWFNGRRDTVIEPGATALTDWLQLPVKIPANTSFWVRTFLLVTAGQTWLQGPTLDSTFWTDQATGSAAETDQTAAAITGAYSRPYGPCGLIAGDMSADTLRIFGVGDSIMNGQGDIARRGWFGNLTASTTIAQRVAVPGERCADLLSGTGFRNRLGFLSENCNAAIVAEGTNDFGVSTLAQMQANLATLVALLNSRGMKVWACTLLPRTTSTDTWITTANQTVFAGEAVRVSYNDWLRTTPNPSGCVGYLELADIVETARNSGKWQVNGSANWATADGTHPTTLFHTTIAAGLSLAPLRAALGVSG